MYDFIWIHSNNTNWHFELALQSIFNVKNECMNANAFHIIENEKVVRYIPNIYFYRQIVIL
jgi:hypothetical protein